MPRVSLVGDGHASPDYATRALWWAAESSVDYGGLPIEAACLGYCGSTYKLSGSSVNGAECYTLGVTWDGTNESSLAYSKACTINVTNSFIEHDYKYLDVNQYFPAFILESDSYESDRVVYRNLYSGSNFNLYGNYPNSHIKNFLIIGGNNGVFAGYNRGTRFTNGLITDCTIGINAAYNKMIVTDVFAFDNGTDYSAGSMIKTNCASEDGTGSVGLTGYTSAELVDFANGDHRTKATSPLATAGTGGSFIGAFLGGVSEPITNVELSGTIELPAITAASVVDYSLPIYSSSALIELPAIEAIGAFNFANAQYQLSGTIELPAITAASVVDYSLPLYSSTALIELPAIEAIGTFNFANAQYQLSGTIELPAITAASIVDYSLPIYSSTALIELPAIKASGTFNYTNSQYQLSGTIELPAITAASVVDYSLPIYSSTALIELPAIEAIGTFNFTNAHYQLSGTIELPAITAASVVDYSLPIYSSTALIELPAITTVIIYSAPEISLGATIVLQEFSTLIYVKDLDTTITLH